MNPLFLRFTFVLMNAAFLLTTSLCAGQAASARPNILFILSDDHATQAVSAYDRRLMQTPHLDRLAREGMRFDRAFCLNALCGPSRATILTGKYSHLNGFTDNHSKFDGSQETFPKRLQRAGYETALVGKWHLVSEPTGFDYWNILPGQGAYHNPVMIRLGRREKHQGYVTDLITDDALRWLKERKSEPPFCLLLHHKAPHANWEPSDQHTHFLANVNVPEPATFNDDYQTRTAQIKNHRLHVGRPQWELHFQKRFGEIPEGLTEPEVRQWVYQRYIKDYLRCIASVDDNVGRVLEFLDESRLRDNTVVVYTSDQGFFLGEHGLYDKRFMYEESLRLPLIVRYPSVIRPGSVNADMVLNLDLAPTLLDLAGVGIPGAMQGRSLRPLFAGQTPADWRTAMYYRFYESDYGVGPMEGVRTKRHKLIRYLYGDHGSELYDLKPDPHELRNLYQDPQHAATKAALEKTMVELKRQFQVPP